ncbi:unnamed protein product, partial [Symbiodinium pilosum]
DYNLSCGEGRQVIDNATWYRCADPAACTELDNETCCEVRLAGPIPGPAVFCVF